MHDRRLDQAGRLFAIGLLGLLLNFLMHAFMTPSYPFGVGMPGVFWLPAFAVCCVMTIWSGMVGACVLLMRPDRERWQYARSCLIIHSFLFILLLFGVMMSFAWKKRFVSSLPFTDYQLLMYDVATFLTAMAVALAAYASYQGSTVFWRIAEKEVPAT